MASPFTDLFASFADGRLTNVYYRREQLARLRQALLASQHAILAATVQDTPGMTRAEAVAELYMTVAALKQHHDSLDPAAELAAEYSIAAAKDAAGQRGAVGVVSIVPQSHSLLYSVLAPLCAALAAGNCVAIVMEKTLQTLPPLVEAVVRALDPDIVAFVPLSAVSDASGDGHVAVVQTGEAAFRDRRHVLVSPSTALSLAVVDRTADLEAAASELVDARMQFAGRSPYAPDVVLVNEFAKTDFLQAVVRHAIRYMTDRDTVPAEGDSKTADRVCKRERPPAAGISVVTSGAYVSILDVVDRASLDAVGKVSDRALYVHAVRSLDDAIEVANDLSHGTAAAAFAFGDLPTCKYLLQFITAHVGLANNVPSELLVGPAAPTGTQPSSLASRYTTDMFSTPQPRFVQPTRLGQHVRQLLCATSAAAQRQEYSTGLDDLALDDRAPVRHIAGYFESAALVGLATIATPVLAGVSYLAVLGVRKALFRK